MIYFQEQPKTMVNDLENRNTTEAQDKVLEIQNTRLREKIKKQSRTHALLVSIVVVFALSWFPLNLLNIILDVHNIFKVFFLSIITTVLKSQCGKYGNLLSLFLTKFNALK